MASTSKSTITSLIPSIHRKCYNRLHIYDKDECRDYYSNVNDKWGSCWSYLCKNRYTLAQQEVTETWAATPTFEQEALIRNHRPGVDVLNTPSGKSAPPTRPASPRETDTPKPSGSKDDPPPGDPKGKAPENPKEPTPPQSPVRRDDPKRPPGDPEDPPPNLESLSTSDSDSDDDMGVQKRLQSAPTLKVDGSNWGYWKDMVEGAAQAEGRDKYLKATFEDTTDGKSTEDYELLFAIRTKIPPQLHSRYKRHTTTFEMWTQMNKDFEQSNEHMISLLLTQLSELRCQNIYKLGAFLDKVITIRDELNSRGENRDDKDYRRTISANLPEQFNPAMKAFVQSKGTTKYTTDELMNYLRAEAQELIKQKEKHKDSAHSAKDTAAFVQSNRSGNRGNFRGNFRGNRGNFRGGSRGGFRGNQPTQNNNNATNNQSSSSNTTRTGQNKKLKCYRCEGFGHLAKDCGSPDIRANSAQETKTKTPQKRNPPKEKAHFAEESEQLSSWDDYAGYAGDSETASHAILMDSGASSHMSPDESLMHDLRKITPRTITGANGDTFTSDTRGTLTIPIPKDQYGNTGTLVLKDTLYCPNMPNTLVSIGKLDDSGYKFEISNGILWIYDGQQGTTIGRIPKDNGLYKINDATDGEYALIAKERTMSLYDLHCILGHVNYDYLLDLMKKEKLTGIKLDPNQMERRECTTCLRGKATRKAIASARSHSLPSSNPSDSSQATKFGDLVHMDVWGPASQKGMHGVLYTLTLLDHATYWLEEPLCKSKDEAFAKYVTHQTRLKTQENITIKVLHSDRGGEFLSDNFTNFLEGQGTIRKLTVHDTPEHNGNAERAHRPLLNIIRTMLIEAGLPKWLWGSAMDYAVYIWNRTPHKAINMDTPYFRRYGKHPDATHMHKFGQIVYVKRETKPDKLGEQAVEGRWIGIDPESNGYRIYWPKKNSYTVERNVSFSDEQIQPVAGDQDIQLDLDKPADLRNPEEMIKEKLYNEAKATMKDSPQLDENDNDLDQPVIEPSSEEVTQPTDPNVLTTKRIRKPTKRIMEIITGQGEGNRQTKFLTASMAKVTSEIQAYDPTSYKEAMTRPDAIKWKQAMDKEMSQLSKRQTYVITELPKGAHALQCKWVYRTRRDENGNIIEWKARLVICGNRQIPYIDYFPDETFASVAKPTSLRIILAIAAQRNMVLHQIDVKAAYLYGKLEDDEIIYMKPPQGVDIGAKLGQVLRLFKALYGLKQAGRRWYLQLFKWLQQIGFTRSEFDHAVFYITDPLIILAIHVDDMTLATETEKIMKELKQQIEFHMEIKDGGKLHWLLGFEVKQSPGRITISQRSYIEAIIIRYGFENLKPLSIPYDPSVKLDETPALTREETIYMENKPYAEAVGALQYLSVGTRPDITFTVSQLTRYIKNPSPIHWKALQRCYQYLSSTKSLCLQYTTPPTNADPSTFPTGYSDSDGMTSADRKAISGYAFILNGGAISWSSKRQSLVALSTTEAEYVALTHAAKEAIWLGNFITEIYSNPNTETKPTKIGPSDSGRGRIREGEEKMREMSKAGRNLSTTTLNGNGTGTQLQTHPHGSPPYNHHATDLAHPHHKNSHNPLHTATSSARNSTVTTKSTHGEASASNALKRTGDGNPRPWWKDLSQQQQPEPHHQQIQDLKTENWLKYSQPWVKHPPPPILLNADNQSAEARANTRWITETEKYNIKSTGVKYTIYYPYQSTRRVIRPSAQKIQGCMAWQRLRT